jgi:hypothetical protein
MIIDIANSADRLQALLKGEPTREMLAYLCYRLQYFPHRLLAPEKEIIFNLVQAYAKTDRRYNSALSADDLRYFKRQVVMRWLISPISKNDRGLAVQALNATPDMDFFDTFRRSHWVHRTDAVEVLIEGYYGSAERKPLSFSSISNFENLINRHPHLTADPKLMYILEQINRQGGGSLRLLLSSLLKNSQFTDLPNAGSILRMWRTNMPQISEWSWNGAFSLPVVKNCLARDASLSAANLLPAIP